MQRRARALEQLCILHAQCMRVQHEITIADVGHPPVDTHHVAGSVWSGAGRPRYEQREAQLCDLGAVEGAIAAPLRVLPRKRVVG